jgi:hypothetical protein
LIERATVQTPTTAIGRGLKPLDVRPLPLNQIQLVVKAKKIEKII